MKPESREERRIVDEFNALYYSAYDQTWKNTYWCGVMVRKTPTDLWIYQEILTAHRPKTIIETGTYMGGSALYLAHICDVLGLDTKIHTIDIAPICMPSHDRITYWQGSSTDPGMVDAVSTEASGPIMVILDSDHSLAHVLRELEAWGPLVSNNQYLIVEDTNISGYKINQTKRGPAEALNQWLPSHPDFHVVRPCEKFMLTQHPGGFLLRQTKKEQGN